MEVLQYGSITVWHYYSMSLRQYGSITKAVSDGSIANVVSDVFQELSW